MVLALIALLIGWESLLRLHNPIVINFPQAITLWISTCCSLVISMLAFVSAKGCSLALPLLLLARRPIRAIPSQFVRSRHGADNDGVASAEPRVIAGDVDATFDAGRAARYTKPGKKTERPFSPQTRG